MILSLYFLWTNLQLKVITSIDNTLSAEVESLQLDGSSVPTCNSSIISQQSFQKEVKDTSRYQGGYKQLRQQSREQGSLVQRGAGFFSRTIILVTYILLHLDCTFVVHTNNALFLDK
jgi:hypothetical protein